MSELNVDDILKPVYSIGYAAKKLGVAVPTLRMYENAGLIIPFRTETNRRLYSYHDIKHLQVIIELVRNHGLNLEGIKRLAALIPCWHIQKCSIEDCASCQAYSNCCEPCWRSKNNSCKYPNTDCRNCQVYISSQENLKNPKLILQKFFHKK